MQIDYKNELRKLKDIDYKNFNLKLIPSFDPNRSIGIRVPKLRELSKRLWNENQKECKKFLKDLPHYYLEENNLHIMFLEKLENIEELIQKTDEFLPYIDNWQTCDLYSPKLFKKYPKLIYEKINEWLEYENLYAKRFAILTLMSNYLDENFNREYLYKVANIETEEYYLKMMIAWYFATALAKQYEESIKIIEKNVLEKWTHNKAIQKSIESRRISNDKKEYLKTLRIK
ncbi:MAG: DNA alkylation repair protein [Tissierellia bacterium]|nr:DNA alkylation repair protein [Tissierellia bacterium]